jgi:hypothetical protein
MAMLMKKPDNHKGGNYRRTFWPMRRGPRGVQLPGITAWTRRRSRPILAGRSDSPLRPAGAAGWTSGCLTCDRIGVKLSNSEDI